MTRSCATLFVGPTLAGLVLGIPMGQRRPMSISVESPGEVLTYTVEPTA
jgi:hypothetical protein